KSRIVPQYWKPPVYYSDDDDDFFRENIDETPPSDAIAPDLPITDSLEDVPVEHFKIYSNPFLEFDKEIFSSEINLLYNEVLEYLNPILPGNENDHFNAESNLKESLLNKDTVITSPKIDFLLEEFAGELALINPIPTGITETNFDPKENIRLIKKLLYDNSSPRPLKELNSENDFNKENSGSTTIFTDISPPEYESFYDESDSASEIFNDDLAHIISSSEYEYVYTDDESDSGDLTTKVVDDISDNSTRELYVYVPNFFNYPSHPLSSVCHFASTFIQKQGQNFQSRNPHFKRGEISSSSISSGP
nr:hypothetical protein [Tanacetum cinerariifolium]